MSDQSLSDERGMKMADNPNPQRNAGMSMFASSKDYWIAMYERVLADNERLGAQVKELTLQALSDSGQAVEESIDAGRYRWIRKHSNTSVDIDLGAGCEISDTLDAAVDDAIAASRADGGAG